MRAFLHKYGSTIVDHRILSTIAAVTILLPTGIWPNNASLIGMASLITIHTLIAIAIPYAPKLASWLLLAMSTASFALPTSIISATPLVFTPFVAVGVIAFCTPSWMGPLAAGIDVMAFALIGAWGHGMTGIVEAMRVTVQFSPIAIVLALTFLAMLAGIAARLRIKALRLAHMEEQVRRMRLSNRMASRLHDGVTNDLSYIAAIARREADCATDAASSTVWEQVFNRVQNTFDQVHDIIAYLVNADDSFRDIAQEPFITHLRQSLDNHDRDCIDMGLHGASSLSVHTDDIASPTADIQEELAALINELYANMKRHCQPGNTYALDIVISTARLELFQTNSLSDEETVPLGGPSGHGLSFHARRIAELGGTLNANGEDGEWVLYAQLPLNGRTTANPLNQR